MKVTQPASGSALTPEEAVRLSCALQTSVHTSSHTCIHTSIARGTVAYSLHVPPARCDQPLICCRPRRCRLNPLASCWRKQTLDGQLALALKHRCNRACGQRCRHNRRLTGGRRGRYITCIVITGCVTRVRCSGGAGGGTSGGCAGSCCVRGPECSGGSRSGGGSGGSAGVWLAVLRNDSSDSRGSHPCRGDALLIHRHRFTCNCPGSCPNMRRAKRGFHCRRCHCRRRHRRRRSHCRSFLCC